MRKLIALAALLTSGSSAAQTLCDNGMSFEECQAALDAALEGAVRGDDVVAEKTAELSTANTGNPTGDGAIDDFNPRFLASLGAVDSAGDDADGTITLSWQDLLRSAFGDDNTYRSTSQQHKLVVKLEPAELYAPLREAIGDDAVADELEEGLDDFDDVSLDLRFSLVSERFGRDLRAPNLIAYVSAIQTVSIPDGADSATAGDAVAQQIQDLSNRPGGFDPAAPLGTEITDPQQRQEFMEALAVDAAQVHAYSVALDANLTANGLYDFLALVNNQPQLILAVGARERDDRVGPNERSLKFSYEFGGVNVRTYERRRAACKGTTLPVGVDGRAVSFSPEEAVAEVDCLRSFMETHREAVKDGNHFAASLEYVQRSSYEFTGPLATPLSLPGEETIVASLTYGRYLQIGQSPATPAGGSRIDVRAAFEDVGNDPNRQDRSKATITFSQKVTNGLFLELAYSWASDPEFLVGDTGDEQSARAGFTYKLASREQ